MEQSKPIKNYDYESTDKLSTILADKRLVTKYHKRYGKYLKINLGRQYSGYPYWQVERALLEDLLKKFGDITFGEAIKKWSKRV